MKIHDPVVVRELPFIRRIIADETWLEGERRGRAVPPGDPVVRQKVCEVILCIGEALRASLSSDVTGPLLGVPGITKLGTDSNSRPLETAKDAK
jgi:hypothetical protein